MNYNPKFFPFYILERETLAATRYIHSIFYELHKKKKIKRKGKKKKERKIVLLDQIWADADRDTKTKGVLFS